ncbi:MAG: hypothetical protein WCK70_19030, partial [Chloroflexales bacterium]
MSSRLRARSLLIALAADAVMGELPNALHPVVWMGRWIGLGERLGGRRQEAGGRKQAPASCLLPPASCLLPPAS